MLDKKVVSQCISSDYCRGWNDAVDAMPRWISVKERLPERGVFVAVYYGHFIGNLVDTFAWDGESWRNSNGFLEDPENITHWMPLPEPPKEATP